MKFLTDSERISLGKIKFECNINKRIINERI